ncbi:MAG: UDP-3-O-(3-hydroxymyristoyl)glucosamine N-acyltransferase [Proteobacteria bacterium]|nr:UDP-3-O-(3-hydroxymyristoyl)glucosamine N-acyltransferase [Pseudomonadota bacterium]MBU1688868.1 UDP-3-O-(3-hydroxymyristoyl)glucosamine N-acyltransferase [Pseudomonadota bacterium]
MDVRGRKLSELAALVGGVVSADEDPELYGLMDIESAGVGEIAFITGAPGKEFDISAIRASALIVAKSFPEIPVPVIRVDQPALAAALIHQSFCNKPFVATGISTHAVVGKDCLVDHEVSIAPGVIIGDRVHIARQVVIHAGAVIEDDVVVGEGSLIYPNVTLLCRTEIGKRVILHSGTVIGSDGFGFVTDHAGRHVKRPHVGNVRIDDEVEIGANSCVDRATFGTTWIKRGTKIDNQVHVGHNVTIGEDCIIVAQVGISGSTELGNNVVLGGKVAIAGHLKLGNRVMVASKAGVTTNQEEGAVVSGFPAIPHRKWLRAATAFQRLPDLISEVRHLRKQVAEVIEKMVAPEKRDVDR